MIREIQDMHSSVADLRSWVEELEKELNSLEQLQARLRELGPEVAAGVAELTQWFGPPIRKACIDAAEGVEEWRNCLEAMLDEVPGMSNDTNVELPEGE